MRLTDDGIGRLLDALARLELYDRIVLSVVADHGEELLERGWLGHTRTLHEELVAVPWLIRAPELPPASVATVMAAYGHLHSPGGADARNRLRDLVGFFQKELSRLELRDRFMDCEAAIQTCLFPGNGRARALARGLWEKGFDLRPILSPTVPPGRERLRFCLHAFNTEAEISAVLAHTKALMRTI